MERPTIGLDAKRIVRNGTGLGSYGRTLANDLASLNAFDLRLYAPDKGRDELRCQLTEQQHLRFCYPNSHTSLGKALWRSHGIVGQLKSDGVRLYHGLSGELPFNISRSGIKSVVTIHDLIFMRHPVSLPLARHQDLHAGSSGRPSARPTASWPSLIARDATSSSWVMSTSAASA